jgi:hypothetical protein
MRANIGNRAELDELELFPTGKAQHPLAWLRPSRMRKPLINRRRQDLMTGVVLVMLLFRAYVPAGFMPAPGTPFLLELCPAAAAMPPAMGMPMDMPMGMDMPVSAHHHSGTHSHFEHCPFGSAPATGPVSHVDVLKPAGQMVSQAAVAFEATRFAERPQRAHQPRGPPALA